VDSIRGSVPGLPTAARENKMGVLIPHPAAPLKPCKPFSQASGRVKAVPDTGPGRRAAVASRAGEAWRGL